MQGLTKMSAALFCSITCAVQRAALAAPVAAVVAAAAPRRAMSTSDEVSVNSVLICGVAENDIFGTE